MNRFPLIAVAVVLIVTGCNADFKPTGFTFQPGGAPEDAAGGEDLIAPPRDTAPDLPDAPMVCDDLWLCVLENGCALAPEIDDSVCLKKCVGEQMDEQVIKFKALKECAAGACATEPTGDAMIQCAYRYCTTEWLSCAAAGDGDKTCGDMHRCLIEDCGPDYSSPQCVSNCLRDGDQKADQWLSLMTACSSSVFFVAAPLDCTGGIAACYAGSGDGQRSCGQALMCEVGCYEQICPDPDFCGNFGDLVSCSYDCLWGLKDEDMERMYAVQQCIVELSHKTLIEDDFNPYSYCALQAHDCLGKQDQFATCGDAVQCLKETYDHFPGFAGAPPQPFWVVVRECLVDVKHADKGPLADALWCLHDKYDGPVTGVVTAWPECKNFCN
jgi:hypothetical protein